MVGRLLQAGWHSPSDIKSHGLSSALSLAPGVRDGLLSDESIHPPRIVADFYVMHLAETAFKSVFLEQELRILLQELTNRKPFEPLIVLPVLWSLKTYLSVEELEAAVGACIRELTHSDSITADDEAEILVLLEFLTRDDKNVLKVIRKRLRRLEAMHPSIRRSILPSNNRTTPAKSSAKWRRGRKF